MSISIASAPGTWGIEPPVRADYPPWRRVLEEIAAAGFDGTELGPLGYLPQGEPLREALASRDLKMPAGFLMEPLSVTECYQSTLALAEETSRTLAAAGALTLVLIDGLSPTRSATAGRGESAERLDEKGWEQLLISTRDVSTVARQHGLAVAFHPHAGTYVEFEDEIERLMGDLDASDVGICLDTGHLAYAGIDPLAMLERYSPRVTHVHLKDLDQSLLESCRREQRSFEQAVEAGVFTPLGAGSLDLGDFATALGEIGYHGWATVEQDRIVERIDEALEDGRTSLRHARLVGF